MVPIGDEAKFEAFTGCTILENVTPPKANPPPTVQTDYGIDLKLGMVTHLVHTFGVIEAMF